MNILLNTILKFLYISIIGSFLFCLPIYKFSFTKSLGTQIIPCSVNI